MPNQTSLLVLFFLFFSPVIKAETFVIDGEVYTTNPNLIVHEIEDGVAVAHGVDCVEIEKNFFTRKQQCDSKDTITISDNRMVVDEGRSWEEDFIDYQNLVGAIVVAIGTLALLLYLISRFLRRSKSRRESG